MSSEAVASPSQSSPAEADVSASSLRVLLVEDQDAVRELYAALLEGAGYQVDTAQDGMQAWELLHQRSYDVLVTDHMMPRMSGIQLLRQLRLENTDLPALMVSGDMPYHEPDLLELVKPGGLLPKPFPPSQFFSALESARRKAPAASA